MRNNSSMRPAILAVALLLALSASGESMWTVREIAEIDGFAQLDGNVALKFKDAVTGDVIRGLSFEFMGETLIGDDQGMVVFPSGKIEDIDDKDIPFAASARGYITLKDTLQVRLGNPVYKRFVMTQGLSVNQIRFVLEWESRPADLDAHLTGPGFHVSYRNTRVSSGNAGLDRDATRGFGPETITITGLRQDAQYEFFVDNFSGEAPMTNVKVTVYFDNRVDRVLFYARVPQKTLSVLTISNGRPSYNGR